MGASEMLSARALSGRIGETLAAYIATHRIGKERKQRERID